MSDFDDYQHRAHEFAGPSCDDFFYPLLGLGGECGEVLDKFKKLYRDRGIRKIEDVPEDQARAISLELGDILWYISEVTERLGFRLQDVTDMNIDKLASRQARNKIGGEGDNR
jgi:NTP pyrophosphatase (non-canonical NTP hydrolase)